MKVIADQIKEARRQLGISQTQAAQAWGISVGAIRNWEQGRTEPRGGAWERLREILAQAALPPPAPAPRKTRRQA